MILPKAELTPSGRPKLAAGEVERVLLDKVDVEFEGTGCTEGCAGDSVYKDGYCVVTSHRLLWIDAVSSPAPGRSCHVPLEAIEGVHKRVQFGLNVMNPKVRLEVKVHVDHTLKVTGLHGSATFKYFHLRCRGEAPDAFKDQLAAALHAHRAALEQQRLQQQQQARVQQQQQQGVQQAQQAQQHLQNATPWAQQGPGASGGSGSFGAAAGVAASGGSAGSSGSWVQVNAQQQDQQQQQLQRPPEPARGLQAVDADLLAQLVDMGFPRPRVVRALLATGSEHAQAALDWLLAAGGDASMDAPLPFPEPAIVSRTELARLQQMQRLQQQQQPPGQQQQQQQPGQQQPHLQQQQLLAPGWGLGAAGAAAAAAAAAGAGMGPSGAAGGGGGGGSSSGWGPMTAAMAAHHSGSNSGGGGGGSPRRGPLPSSSSAPSFGAANTANTAQAGGGGGGSSSRVVGVAGIMTREAEKASLASASLAVAFQDLAALMGMAAEMVKLAEKFRGVMGPDGSISLNPASASSSSASLASLQGGSSGSDLATAGGGGGSGVDGGSGGAGGGASGGGPEQQLLLDAETQLQLIAMGITSPVTRASAGARYQTELCRQLADFLAAPLAKAGGLLMLPDVYCLFNRARGTELVSPDDLLQACEAFAQVGLPLRLRTFPSGVIVVQGSQFSDAQLCRSIAQLLQHKGAGTSGSSGGAGAGGNSNPLGLGPALSAADVSGALALPLTLAKEALLVAEGAGVLCRDDGPEGLRFFRNFFADAATRPLPLPVR